jgi:hypothetical protein
VLLVSFLLVIVATIFLLSGLFLTGDLPLIIISIVCSALAGLVLVAAVIRSRPRPATMPAYEGGPAAAPLAAGDGLEVAEPAPGREAEAAPGRRFAGRPFPIPDYDSLEVVEVLPLLAELEPEDLEMVRQREASGRAHPWILARIDALLESEVAEAGWSKPAPAGDWSASDFPLESRSELDELSLEADGIEVVQEFPIADYDDLKVSEILPLLPKLDPIELRMVRQEEASGRARTSIISRIDSLLSGAGRVTRTTTTKRPSRAALPIENYDDLTVPQITARLAQLNQEQLKALRNYEKRHKARAGVLAKIESALKR